MNFLTKSLLLPIVLLTFSACGGGSGDSNVSTPTPTPTQTQTPVSGETYQGLVGATGANAGTASVSNGVYTYSYNGTNITVTDPGNGIKAGGIASVSTNGTRIAYGGTTYSYSRFGAISPSSDTSQSQVYYVGTKTETMPIVGSATYTGRVVDNTLANSSATFNVDYGAKTISGSTSALTFSNGTITGSDFTGTVSGNGQFNGSFFGPDAAELGGVGTTNGTAFAFGAKK